MFTNYVIYGDVLFLLNFLLDFTVLWACGRFLKLPVSYGRNIFAATIGALYGVGILVPGFSVIYMLGFKVLFPIIMLLIAYPYKNLKSLLALAGVFYLISFAMAGAALGGSTLLNNYGLQIDGVKTVRGVSLLFALAIAMILAKKGIQKLRKNWKKENFKINMEIFAGDRSCKLTALIDTGNELYDPVSGKPVIVAEYASLLPLLPQGVRRAIESHGETDPARVMEEGAIDGWERRFRLVPFASIGKSHGLLLGFRPDNVLIHGEEEINNKNVIICFYLKKFPQTGGYKAIVNPEVMELLEVKKEVSL